LRLNYSSYANTLLEYFKLPPPKNELPDLLLSAAFKEKDKPGVTEIDSAIVSDYLNGKREIKRRIKEAYDCGKKPKARGRVYSHFKTKVIPEIDENRIDALLEKFSRLIEGDRYIPEKQKEILLEMAQEDSLNEFLAEAFIYAILQNNVVPQGEADMKYMPSPYLLGSGPLLRDFRPSGSQPAVFENFDTLNEVGPFIPELAGAADRIPTIKRLKHDFKRVSADRPIYPDVLSEEEAVAFLLLSFKNTNFIFPPLRLSKSGVASRCLILPK